MPTEYNRGENVKDNTQSSSNRAEWPIFGTENFVRLTTLRHNPICGPNGEINLMPAKPYEWPIKFYNEAFSDPVVTEHLNIRPDFSGEEYITKMNGPIGNDLAGSQNNVLYLIYTYTNGNHRGPVGHVSVKEIDWQNLTFHRGMVLKRDFMGRGIGPKAGYLLLSRMKKLGFQRAYTEIKAENKRSINAVEKQFGEGVLKDDGVFHFELDLTRPLTFNPFGSVKL